MKRDILTALVGIIGLALIGVGIWLVHIPSSLVVVGTMFLLWSYTVAKAGAVNNTQPPPRA